MSSRAASGGIDALRAADTNGTLTGRVHVVLADGPQLVRASMSLLIDSQPDMAVVLESGAADDIATGVSRLRVGRRVVAVVGLGMAGDHDAFWLIREIRERVPSWPVIACGQNANESDISRALLVGADGYVNKDCGPVEFIQTIRDAQVGQLVLTGVPSGLLGRIADGLDRPAVPEARLLTERELEVLRVATQGLTARQIGHRLGVRERTVTTHLGRIYRKLGTGSRVAAIAAAAQSGLVSVGRSA
jgi:DNA-binding NarL/FixJ family response regulator